jgi:hypothetical protein
MTIYGKPANIEEMIFRTKQHLGLFLSFDGFYKY